MMRLLVGTGVILLAVAASTAAQSREFSRTVELSPGGKLRIVGSKGSIQVTSWGEPRVEVRARIEPPEDEDAGYAAEAVAATRIEVTGSADSVTVASDYANVPTRNRRGNWRERAVPAVHYVIRTPRQTNLSVNSDRGPLSITGIEGTFDIVVDRGELDLRDLSGDVQVDIDRGERSRIEGVRGSLRLEADRTDMQIEARALDRDSRIEIDRGEVELRVPEAQRLTVRTDISRRGGFHTDFPIQWMTHDPGRSEGHINGGGTELSVHSDRARIELRKTRN